MAIELSAPVTVPAVAEKVFDKVWLSEMSVDARNPNGPVKLTARINPMRINEDGKVELTHVNAKSINVSDFFSTATESELGVMYQVIMMLLARTQ